MWKVTYTINHAEGAQGPQNPPESLLPIVQEMRIWAMENGLLDVREEVVSPTQMRVIYIWDSKESNTAFRTRWANEIQTLESQWMNGHMSDTGSAVEKHVEAVV